VSTDKLEIIEKAYQAGCVAFESGQYAQSVRQLEIACGLVDRNSRLGSEISMWLVTAYEAAGQNTDAIELCKQLTRHPRWETRQQAKRLLYILEAPKLNSRPEWLVQIPDLATLDQNQNNAFNVSPNSTVNSSEKKKEWIDLKPVDSTQVNTKENSFLWVALVGLTLTIIGLMFFV
jgi:hypothetical protein